MTLPPFPVDEQTLTLVENALTPTGGRTSIGDLCTLYSQLGGSATDAVEEDDGTIQVLRDPQYHPDDIITALIAEVRRLRTT